MGTSTVTSEALQLKIRQLLPSQQGFGTDLSASDTIIPIIDLTAAAEGSQVPEVLQRAQAFGSANPFGFANTTTVLASSPGFWQIQGLATIGTQAGAAVSANFKISNGSATKTIWAVEAPTGLVNQYFTQPFSFVIFLSAGDSFQGTTDDGYLTLYGSYRQIADTNGNLINPSGFNPQ